MLQVILAWFDLSFTGLCIMYDAWDRAFSRLILLSPTHCFLPSSGLLDAALLREVSQC